MIIEYIRYRIEEHRQQDFVSAYNKAFEQLDISKYCLGYELSHCVEDTKNYILRIEWTSGEDHLTGFRNSPGFIIFLGHVRPFFNDIQEMNHYEVTNVFKKKN